MSRPDEHVFLYYRSPEDIRGETFNHRMRGVDEQEVREFLALLADQVDAAEHEREQLLAELEELRAENDRLREATSGAEATGAGPADPGEAEQHAAAVLNQAQAVADQLVGEARERAQSLVASAADQGRTVVRQARERTEHQLRSLFDGVAEDFEQLDRAVGSDAATARAPFPQQRDDPLSSPNW